MKLKTVGDIDLPPHSFDELRITPGAHQRAVIDEFYREYSLPEIRNSLWQLARFTAAGSFRLQETEELDNLMVFYRRLEEVLEVVDQQRKQIN